MITRKENIPALIGLLGKAGSGKDTVGKMVTQLVQGARTLAFADPLKEICKQVYDFTDEQLYGPSEKRNEPDKRYLRVAKGAYGTHSVGVDHDGHAILEPDPKEDVYLTPRYALQTLGTEWGRDCYPNTWLELGLRRAREMLKRYDDYTKSFGLMGTTEPMASVVVITDCRFVNEAKAIRDAGGQVWRITRPTNLTTIGFAGVAGHASEAEQDSAEMNKYVTHEILNNSTLADLKTTVGVALGV